MNRDEINLKSESEIVIWELCMNLFRVKTVDMKSSRRDGVNVDVEASDKVVCSTKSRNGIQSVSELPGNNRSSNKSLTYHWNKF